ncbi:MAG: HEPN domain-containing protein [Ferruginibacter sp.]
MADFSEKSIQSLDSARYLVKQHFYSSTVNRAYYACFQYIMYVLIKKLNRDEKMFHIEAKNSPNGTHTWACKVIGIDLAKKSYNDYKWFQKEIVELREKRVLADYHSAVITPEEGNVSITKAESIINVLKGNFK